MLIDDIRRDLDELRRDFRDFDDRFDAFVRWTYEVYEWWRGEGGGPAVPAARGLTERQIRETVARLRQRQDRGPTLGEAATELHMSERTLRRAMDDLKMGDWPPPPPEDWPDLAGSDRT